MICEHQFIRINDASKLRPGTTSYHGMIAGASAGCVKCGQTRVVYEDGQLVITAEGGKQIEEDSA